MRLLLVAIALVILPMRSKADDKTSPYLEQIKTTTSVPDYQSWYKAKDYLEQRNQRVRVYTQRPLRFSSKPGVYVGLTANPYEGLRDDKECETCEIETSETMGTIQALIFDGAGTNIQPSEVTKTQSKPHKCECGDECNCAPLVCKHKACDKSYAVIFGSTDKHSQEMWGVVTELRSRDYIVFYLDVEKHPVVNQFNLKKTPTTLVVENKDVIARFNGVTSADAIVKHLKTRTQQGAENANSK